jgi:uncharacterized protein YndB with AHSA1/START domain
MTDAGPLEVTVHIAARREIVFAYFTDPARYAEWMGSRATLEPVPGGSYRVSMRDGVQASGEFIEVDPPRRLVFTWGWTHDHAVAPGSTRVEVTLLDEDGGTRVILHHHDLPSDDQRKHHRQGWELYLTRLAIRATGGDPGPDPNT